MIRDGWFCCPKCGKKLFKVNEKAVAHGLSIKCKSCKNTIQINIESL
jgi:transcription elongation factor Elf1